MKQRKLSKKEKQIMLTIAKKIVDAFEKNEQVQIFCDNYEWRTYNDPLFILSRKMRIIHSDGIIEEMSLEK